MRKSPGRLAKWYKITFRPHSLSVPRLAAELDGREFQRALVVGHITRRLATLSDVIDYRQLPSEKRLEALNAARYASAFNAVSPLPIVVALIALWASFTPRVADALGVSLSGQITTMWLLLLVLVVVGMHFLFDQARSLGRARTWAEMLADAEKDLSAIRPDRLVSPPRARRATFRVRATTTSRLAEPVTSEGSR